VLVVEVLVVVVLTFNGLVVVVVVVVLVGHGRAASRGEAAIVGRHIAVDLGRESSGPCVPLGASGPGAEGARSSPGISQASEPSERGNSGEQVGASRPHRRGKSWAISAIAAVNLSGPTTEGEGPSGRIRATREDLP
jgi:hypothetical protein